jgi:hypothetical protein
MTPLPPFDVLTPLGPAVCIGILAETDNVEWVTFIKATGEPWFWQNPDIRRDLDITQGRQSLSPFGPPGPKLQRHIDRYRANGWLPPQDKEPNHG